MNLKTAVERLQPFDTPAMRATQGERSVTKREITPFVLSALRSKAYRSMSGVATAVSRMKRIKAKGIEVTVYEPTLKEQIFFHSRVTNDLAQFKQEADVIVASRITDDIRDVVDKVYSLDLFGKD